MLVARNEGFFMLALTALLIGVVVVGAEPVHPVLERYPSREALQQRIDEAKRTDSEAFELARNDFDQAIWARRSINWPRQPNRAKGPRPIKKSGPKLNVLLTRMQWERHIARVEQEDDGKALSAFYREHLDELYIDDDNPMLELALIDVVLNGWDDWTHWDHEKLIKLRDRYPQLHRVYAIRELRRLRVNEATGLLLKLLAEPEVPSYVWNAAIDALELLYDKMGQLEFVVETAYSAENWEIRERLQRKFSAFARRALNDPQARDKCREFWAPYLESEVPILRYVARTAHGLPNAGPMQMIYEQQEWTALHARDPARRKKAAEAIRTRERLKEIKEQYNDR